MRPPPKKNSNNIIMVLRSYYESSLKVCQTFFCTLYPQTLIYSFRTINDFYRSSLRIFLHLYNVFLHLLCASVSLFQLFLRLPVLEYKDYIYIFLCIIGATMRGGGTLKKQGRGGLLPHDQRNQVRYFWSYLWLCLKWPCLRN